MLKFKFLIQEECDFIKDYILENEQKVKDLGPDEYEGTGDNSLSGRHGIFNWLNTSIGDILIPKLRKTFIELDLVFPVYVQCWGNTFRNKEGIKPHPHNSLTEDGTPQHPDFICVHLFISGPTDVGTYYDFDKTFWEDFKDKRKSEESYQEMLYNINWTKHDNYPGEITLFDSMTAHYVPPNPNDEVRITLEMDIYDTAVLKDKKMNEELKQQILTNRDRYHVIWRNENE